MTESEPTMTANRLAMSKALGAAFLNHQVEQLEKSVANTGPGGNWRERQNPHSPNNRDYAQTPRGQRFPSRPNGTTRTVKKVVDGPANGGREEKINRHPTSHEKDADVVVVDASVLVHGISHVKKWCREERQEVVIVPLEALNTLDLLKKGTSTLAQKARAASRMLETHVGCNPRIRVQNDRAYVPWEEIHFTDKVEKRPSPEWVRRTICCAHWEANNVNSRPLGEHLKVVLAVCHPDPEDSEVSQPGVISASPVPLPAPQLNRNEVRCTGTLIADWAAKSSLDVIHLPPSGPTSGNGSKESNTHGVRRPSDYDRRSPDDEKNKGSGTNRGRRSSHQRPDTRAPTTPGSLVERPPAVMAMMEAIAQPSRVVRVLARGEKLD